MTPDPGTTTDRGPAEAYDAAEPQQPFRHGLAPYARRHRGSLVRGLLFTLLLVACRLALPLPLGALVAQSSATAAPSGHLAHLPAWADPVTFLAAGFVSLALAAGMAEYFQRLAFANFANRSVNDARSAANARLSRRDPASSADLTAQVLADSTRVKQALKGVLNHIVLNALLVVGACAALALADPALGIVELVGVVLLMAIAVRSANRVSVVAAAHRAGEAALAKEIHRFAATDRSELSLRDVQSLHRLDAASGRADVDLTRVEGRCTCVAHVVLAATAGVVLLLGVSAATTGRLHTGVLFTVVGYLLVLHGPGVRLARQTARIGGVRVSAEHLGRVLVQPGDEPPLVPAPPLGG